MTARTTAALAGVLLAGLPVLPATAAPVDNCARSSEIDASAPWPRGLLRHDDVWAFTRGGGTTVAVLSTGVDRGQPQLKGRVLAGFDAVDSQGDADSDCASMTPATCVPVPVSSPRSPR